MCVLNIPYTHGSRVVKEENNSFLKYCLKEKNKLQHMHLIFDKKWMVEDHILLSLTFLHGGVPSLLLWGPVMGGVLCTVCWQSESLSGSAMQCYTVLGSL